MNKVRSFGKLFESNFYVENKTLLNTLIDYFEDMWIGCSNRQNGRRLPNFSIEMWNSYDSIIHLPRKTNVNLPRKSTTYEQLGIMLSMRNSDVTSHVTIWKFILTLKKEQVLQEVPTYNNIILVHNL